MVKDVNEKERNIPLKNYFVLFVVLVLSIFFVYYLYLWYIAYEESKLNTPIMDRYLQVINYNEIDSYIAENKEAILYVSVLENKEIRDFEIDFKKTIHDLDLTNEMLYLDLTDIFNNQSLLKDAVSKYNINNNSISDVPCIMVFSDGSLVDIYNIKDNKYNINNISLYLEDKGIVNSD